MGLCHPIGARRFRASLARVLAEALHFSMIGAVSVSHPARGAEEPHAIVNRSAAARRVPDLFRARSRRATAGTRTFAASCCAPVGAVATLQVAALSVSFALPGRRLRRLGLIDPTARRLGRAFVAPDAADQMIDRLQQPLLVTPDSLRIDTDAITDVA